MQMEQSKIINYLQRINQSDKSLDFIKQLESELQLNQETHVSIECQMAFMLWDVNLKSFSINRFRNLVRTEIENDFPNYGSVFADSVGMAISFLIENEYKKTNNDLKDIFRMGYVYLSKHIEMYGSEMCDSFRHRAYLFENCNRQAESLGIEYLKTLNFIPIPLAMSDYYSAGKAYHNLGYMNKYRECIERGAYLHDWLDDMRINGKDADSYEFTEMADLGRQRIELLNSKITNWKIFDSNKIIELINQT